MSYQILYGQTNKKEKKPKSWALITVIMLILGIMVGFRIAGIEPISLKSLLPGDGTVTAAAVDEMVTSLRCGDRLLDAVDVFCRTVVEGAGLG